MGKSGEIPGSIAAIGQAAATGLRPFDFAVREFLDAWQSMDNGAKRRAIRDEPCRIADVQDAYLAGLAEHLAQLDRLPVPDWTGYPDRFLDTPFFAGGLEFTQSDSPFGEPAGFSTAIDLYQCECAVAAEPRVHPGQCAQCFELGCVMSIPSPHALRLHGERVRVRGGHAKKCVDAGGSCNYGENEARLLATHLCRGEVSRVRGLPCFRDAPVAHILNAEELSPGHYYRSDLDVDLSLNIIERPQDYPLKAK